MSVAKIIFGAVGVLGASFTLYAKRTVVAEEPQPSVKTPSLKSFDQRGFAFTWGAVSSLFGNQPATGVPTKVPHGKVVAAAVGYNDAAYVDSAGRLHTVGSDGTITKLHDGPFKSVECGRDGLLIALKKDGRAMYRYSTSAPLEVLGKAHWLWGAPKFSKISAGDYHAALIGNDGKLYAIGLNTEGQVSHPDLECRVVGAYPVPLRDDVIDVACGSTHTIAITKSGQGYAFGNSQMYQLGIQPVWARPAQPPPPPASPVGPLAEVPWPNMDVFQVDIHKHAVPNPSLITFFEYNKIKLARVVCGEDTTLVIDTFGNMYGFGRGAEGQFGDGNKRHVSGPRMIQKFPFGDSGASKIRMMSCGSKHCVAVFENGNGYSWGFNNAGQLATGDKTMRLTPTQVLEHAQNITSLNCKGDSCVVVS